jgi:hypothetical protein
MPVAKFSGNILQGIGRIAKGSKLAPHHGVRNREGIAPQQIDVLENERGKPRQVFGLDGIAFACKLIQSSVDVKGIPQNNDVHDQAQRAQLILLPLPISLAQLSSLPVEYGAAQFVPVFASI